MRTFLITSMVCLAALGAHISEARACGGCFHQEEQSPEQISVVTGHTMALSISTEQTVLWDRVQYSGSPEEFAWVLPVRPGAEIEIATDAFFEALDAATGIQVTPPALSCDDGMGPGFGCGPATLPLPTRSTFACSSDGAGLEGEEGLVQEEQGPVTVVHEGSVGPYETVTLSTEEPDALPNWLIDNGYAIGEDIFPILEDYAAEGFDFIAMRLAPEAGVQQMKPVRVVQDGAVASLPLRMVAAGTGAQVGLTLYVIAEGRWETANFPALEVPTQQLSWDFNFAGSNYSELRQNMLQQQGGRAWLTTFARPGALTRSLTNPVDGRPVTYVAGNQQVNNVAQVYAQSAWLNGETDDVGNCLAGFFQHGDSDRPVIPSCALDEELCEVPQGFIDAAELTCGDADDLAVALTGMRPSDVWITRLDADLPRQALADDLLLQAQDEQSVVHNWLLATGAQNAPCPLQRANPASSHNGLFALLTLGGLFVGMTLRRRRRDEI